jgi:hypothetical protein
VKNPGKLGKKADFSCLVNSESSLAEEISRKSAVNSNILRILLDFCGGMLYNNKQNEHRIQNSGNRRQGELISELSELEN